MNQNRIGYGTWPLSGNFNGSISYGKVNDDDSILALNKAFDIGINIYDTADFYGYGHVESLLGKVFHDKRDKIKIITKGGMVSNNGNQNFTYKHLYKSLKESLKRLKTNYVDFYMLHSPSIDILEDGKIIETLYKFKKSGMILKFGVSVKTPDEGLTLIKNYFVDIIEVNYNILDMRADHNGLLELCNKYDIKTVIRTPLGQGILTGTFSFNKDKSDRRNLLDKTNVNKSVLIYKKMLNCLLPNSYTNSQNCLRFCLSNKYINVIIPGMKFVTEVQENFNTQFLPELTQKEKECILNIYNKELLCT